MSLLSLHTIIFNDTLRSFSLPLLFIHLFCLDLITIQFSTSAYDVNENSGTAQPVLQLDPALECCSVSVLIKIEDFTRGT